MRSFSRWAAAAGTFVFFFLCRTAMQWSNMTAPSSLRNPSLDLEADLTIDEVGRPVVFLPEGVPAGVFVPPDASSSLQQPWALLKQTAPANPSDSAAGPRLEQTSPATGATLGPSGPIAGKVASLLADWARATSSAAAAAQPSHAPPRPAAARANDPVAHARATVATTSFGWAPPGVSVGAGVGAGTGAVGATSFGGGYGGSEACEGERRRDEAAWLRARETRSPRRTQTGHAGF